MRILLDESLPIELRDELLRHSVRSVQEMGWSALKNGKLLCRAVDQFDAFVTVDQDLQYKENVKAHLVVRRSILHVLRRFALS